MHPQVDDDDDANRERMWCSIFVTRNFELQDLVFILYAHTAKNK